MTWWGLSMLRDNTVDNIEVSVGTVPVEPLTADFEDAVSAWVRFVDQDSQSETFEFLDESAAKHSGE